MEISILQIIILCVYGCIAIWDEFNLCLGFNKPVFAGLFAGIVLGDVATDMYVGATLQLMILGIGAFGGASMPDYMSGAIIGTAFSITSGSTEVAIGIAISVGLLLVNFDLLARFANAYFQKMADVAAEKSNYRKVERANLLGVLSWGLSRAIPIFICLIFGQDLVNLILEYSPQWLLDGLKVAAGVLPALGIAILLRYLPVQKYWAYVIFGFVAIAYLKIPMLGAALIGVALAAIAYLRKKDMGSMAMPSKVRSVIEDDE